MDPFKVADTMRIFSTRSTGILAVCGSLGTGAVGKDFSASGPAPDVEGTPAGGEEDSECWREEKSIAWQVSSW